MALVFLLASSRNMRSGGIGTPARFVSFSIEATRFACCSLSGSNLLNSGSITKGMITMITSRMATAGNQKSNHQRRGLKRSEEHTSELQSRLHLVCRLLLEKKKVLHMSPQ